MGDGDVKEQRGQEHIRRHLHCTGRHRAGLVLDGGKISQVLQPTAALIVIGGTVGAVMVQFPMSTVFQAIAHLKDVFLNKEPESDQIIENLLRYALKARKEGILSLDGELNKIHDPFLNESLMLAIDGVNATDLRKMMELHLDYRGEKEERSSESVRVGCRFCADDRHHRRGSGTDPGNAAAPGHQ